MNSNKGKRDMLAIKLKAMHLYINEGKSAKETAEELGVSENSMSKWVIQFHWKASKKRNTRHQLAGTGEESSIRVMDDFKSFIRITNPPLYKKIEAEINRFLKLTN